MSRLKKIIVYMLVLSAASYAKPMSPVEANGQLQVKGTYLLNQSGEAVQLRGVATHGLQWFNTFYGEGQPFEAAADDWGVDAIRFTLYLSEDGYLTSKKITKAQFEEMLDKYIQVCVQKGVYAIIDWHTHKPGFPGFYLAEAKTFFTAMAAKYALLPNVIWEICNEPSAAGLTELQSGKPGVTDGGHYTTWSEITTYAKEVIPIIKAKNPDAVVLVGTPSWSTLGISTNGNDAWKEVANNKLSFSNILYVIHYYANAHTFQGAFEEASKQLPLFSTEWATAGYQETSNNDQGKGQSFVDMLARRKISWCYWNYSNGTPGIFATYDSTTTTAGPFAPSGSNVTPTGKLVYKWLSEPADPWSKFTSGLQANNSNPISARPTLPIFNRTDSRMTITFGEGTKIKVIRNIKGESITHK